MTANGHTIDRIFDLLGDGTFYVPCEPGTKRPIVTYADREFKDTLTGPYRSLVRESNVAVYLGAASGGLCAIDFDTDEPLDAFLKSNPRLSKSLRSRGARGAQIWVRITGDIPESMRCDKYEWRADRNLSTIWGLHPSGSQYTLLVDAAPVAMPFADIVWPDGWIVPGNDHEEKKLLEQYGEPWLAAKSGAPVRMNQRFFAALVAKQRKILFDSALAAFYEYTKKDGCWHYRSEAEVNHIVSDTIGQFINDAARHAPKEYREAIRSGHQLNNAQFQRGVVTGLRGIVLTRDAFSRRTFGAIHVANGMLDLTAHPFAFQSFAPEHYSRNQIPVEFVPGATCPRFLAELLEPQMTADDIHMLQLWCGQAILQRNLHQVFMVLTGTAGGGKGTIARVIRLMIGEHNIHQLRTKHLAERFEVGLFHGKTLLYGPDVPPDFLSNDGSSTIKALTGGDNMTGEVKGSMQSFSIKGEFNVLITSNSRLIFKVAGDAQAWCRRMLWIKFEQPPPEKPIPNFDEILVETEGPGILNWMLEGAIEIMRCAREHQPLPVSPEQRSRVRDLISESDSVREFVNGCVRKSSFSVDSVTKEQAYRVYLEICEKREWNALTQRVFWTRVEDILISEFGAHPDKHLGDDRNERGWRGITLRDYEYESQQPF